MRLTAVWTDAVLDHAPEGRSGSASARRVLRYPSAPSCCAMRSSVDGYRHAGALVAELGVPVVAVHEGGYHLPSLGTLTVAALSALVDGGTG